MTRYAYELRDALDRRPRLTAALLVGVAAVVLLARLGSPDRIMFDETYYVEDARGFIDTWVEPSFAVHPTVGKWFIAAGIGTLGDSPFGWRVAGALAGVVIVLVTHLLARRLLADTRWGPLLAVLAPLLLLTDGLFVTQARIAMLDIYLVLFTVVALWLLVVDRDRRRVGAVRSMRPSLRWAAGVALGLATAVKWSGLMAIGAAGLLTIAWEVGAVRRSAASVGAGAADLVRRGAAVLGSLVVVPLVAYSLTWIPWLAAYEHTWAADCDDEDAAPDCEGVAASAPFDERVDGLLRYHEAGLDFHLGLESEHSYRSDPFGWVVLQRPVVYYWEACSEDRAAGVQTENEDGELVDPEPCDVPVDTAGEIMALGNPVVWWGWLLAIPVLAGGLVRRDGRSAVALVTWLSLWVPWLFVSRLAFLFYLAPAVPFMVLGLAVALQRLDRRERILGAYVGALLGGGIGTAVVWLQQTALFDDGWRPRLMGLALGAFVVALLGSLLDQRRDRTAPLPATPGDAPSPFARPAAADDWPEPGQRDGRDDDLRPDEPPPSPIAVAFPAGSTTSATPSHWPASATPPTSSAPTSASAGGAVTVLEHDGTPRPPTPPTDAPTGTDGSVLLAPSWRVPALSLALVVGAVSLFTFFGPVWYGVPLARDVLEWRWWFSSWI